MSRKNATTVALADLELALGATIPFAGEDETSPSDFHVLQLAADDDQFTVTATDGYVAGRVTKPATGRFGTPFQLDRAHAQLLRSALAFHLDVLSTMPVTLTVTDDGSYRLLTVGIDLDFTFYFHDRLVRPSNINRIFATPTSDEPATGGTETSLSVERIAPFLQVAALAPKEPLRWTLHGPGCTSYVRLGDWFTGVLMPVATAVTSR